MAVLIGEGPVELNPDETVNITPINSTETYQVPQVSVLGALDVASELGGFEYQVAEGLPPEQGNLSIFSITNEENQTIENEVMNGTSYAWTYWINDERGMAGPAVTNVTDGDNVTYSYGPPSHSIVNASYTLIVNASVSEAAANVTPTPTVNVTPTPTVNVTPTPPVNVTPSPTVNVTPTPPVNVTPSPTVNVTPTPPMNLTVTPVVNISDQPIMNATVVVDNATIHRPGWADIHADLNGTPGAIIGYSPITPGVNENVTVAIEVENATPVLYAMLHLDQGVQGVHEFPGPDVPVLLNGSPVQQAFNVTGGLPSVNVTPTPTVNVTPTPTVNVTPTPTVNVTPTPTVNVTPTPTVNVTPTPTVNVTPTPTVNVTPTPTVNVTPTPTVNVTPTPTVNVTPTPTVNVTPTPTVNVTPTMTPTPAENVTPAINVSDQPIVNATVVVDNATINRTGWADIHADMNGTPGAVIGYSPISPGVNENVTIAIDVEEATPVLYAMLHIDEGEEGVHEFPGPDMPVLLNGSPVQQAFNVTGGLPPVNVTPTPTVNVTPTPTVNVTPTPTVNVTPTPTVNVTPTPTVNVTPTPTVNVTPTPTVNVTPTPTVNVTPTPTVNVTPTPTVNVTPTPTVNVTPTPTVNVTPTPTAEANVTIIEPMEGASIPAGNVTVSVNVTNFTLVEPTGQENAPGEGHLHYYLDAPIPMNESEPAIPPTGGYVISTNLSHTWENVTAGEHNLTVQLVNNDHTPLIPLAFETVNVTVEENVTPTPTVNVTPTPTVNVTPTPTPVVNITDLIAMELAGEENLTTFVEVVNNSTLDQSLEENRTYIICAPTNVAFEDLGNETLSIILNNTTVLNTILEYHVILGDYTVEELVMLCQNATDGQISLPTVEGTEVNATITDDGQLIINNFTVVDQIQITNNIIVYVIDGVLIPPDVTIPTPTPTPTPTMNVTPTPTMNVTPTPTMNVTPTPTMNVTPTPTMNVTPTPTMNVTPTPTMNVTPTPTMNVTPTPTMNVTPTPTMNVTPTPTMNVTPTPTMNVTPTPTMTPTPPTGEIMDLELYEGWNFISIPRPLSAGNNTAASVFSEVDTGGRLIYTFAPATGFTPVGENETLEVLEGYWVYSTEDTTMELNLSTNPLRAPAMRTLSPGWNAIGYSDLTARTAEETLGSVEDIWVYVVGFDAENQSYRPAFINNQTGEQGEDQQLNPTEGYWLFVREDGRLAAIST
ncbi:fasciclin domain-containing protein [Methanoculleus sp.]|uniref:DUF7282 domain-containing protein n=3 Tax=Methanoculleus sp. TaxID=90427 RepID=UPI0025F9920D|nr:fasciclin domain-containing protein [Methanoculleus sp.]